MAENIQKSLTDEQIAANKEEFIRIMNESGAINRPQMAKLLDWLENTDFYVAPASTRFHGSYAGGLCAHSLNVHDEFKAECERRNHALKPDSIAIMALLHDLCKTNFYKPGFRNVKNEETGKWEKVPTYTIEDQFPMGHGEKSVFLIERFVKLKTEEAIGIRWHMGSFDEAVKGGSFAMGAAYEMYPTAASLHMADMAATYMCGE